jgi:hypothetical protein
LQERFSLPRSNERRFDYGQVKNVSEIVDGLGAAVIPFVVSVRTTFANDADASVSACPPGQVNAPASTASRVRQALMLPFFPDAKLPDVETGPLTVILFAAFGH